MKIIAQCEITDDLMFESLEHSAPDDLPKAVAEAFTKQVPGGTAQNVSKIENRAGLRFVALPQPRVIYIATLEGGIADTIRLHPDGTVVKEINPFGKKK